MIKSLLSIMLRLQSYENLWQSLLRNPYAGILTQKSLRIIVFNLAAKKGNNSLK